jgi:putative methyltransferase (TIGR04325 family)
MAIKGIVKQLTPPILVEIYRSRFKGFQPRRPEWEYVPDGWRIVDPAIKGWNVASIVEKSLQQWPAYVKALRGPEAIRGYYGGSPEGEVAYDALNMFMSFAYVVALAAQQRRRLSVLDWGGGLGQYYEFAKALLPSTELEYHCRELPLLCEAGRSVAPEVCFHEDDRCLERHYDLVFASGVIQYHEDWKGTLSKLASATGDYLFVTRIPVVERAPSFVVVQRPYKHDYDTEYLGWFLNRDELLDEVKTNKLDLVREFYIQPQAPAANAPDFATCRGVLARRPSR